MISILFIIIKIGIFQYINSIELNLKKTHAFSLSNGNVFILHEDGVNVYNYNFTICLYSYDFDGIKLIPINVSNKYISIIQCSDSNQYVVTFIYKKIYIFSNRGEYLFNVQNLDSYFLDFITIEPIYEKISFLYYNNQNNVYQFFLTYTNNEAKLRIIKFGINMICRSFQLQNNIFYNEENITSSNCQIMIDNNSSHILSCFYTKQRESYMFAALFDIEDNITKLYDIDIKSESMILIPVKLIESLVSKNKGIALISYIYYSIKSEFLIFNVNNKKIISSYLNMECDYDRLTFTNYFKYSDLYLYSCKKNNIINIISFPDIENIGTPYMLNIKYEGILNITNYQLVFLPYKNRYILIIYSFCNESNSHLFENIEIYSPNYKEPSNNPESDFFYTSTSPFTSIPIENNDIIKTNPDAYSTIQSIIPTIIESTFPTTSIQKNIPSSSPLSTVTKFLITSSLKMNTTTPIVTTLNAQTAIPNSISTSSLSKASSNILTTNQKSKTTIISAPTLFSSVPSKISTSISSSLPLKKDTNIPFTSIFKTDTNIPFTSTFKINTSIPFISTFTADTGIPFSSTFKTNTSIPFISTFKADTSIPFTSIFKVDTSIPFSSSFKATTSIPFTSTFKIESTVPLKIESSNPLKIETTVFPISQPKLKTTIPQIIDSTILYKSNDIQTYFTTPSLSLINGNSPQITPSIHCPIKCSSCNIEGLCIKCNIEEKYYPVINSGDGYYECYNEEKAKSSGYFFNKETEYYEPCFSRCKTCNYKGNNKQNNCTSCKNGFRFRPDEKNYTNCVVKCDYYYYINIFNQYFCTESNQCPIEVSLLIRDKGQCVDSCSKDNEYIYQFNYECFKECPEDTIKNEINICEVKNKKKCYLYSDNLLNSNFNSLESNNFNTLIKRYITGFNDTDLHVDFYLSQNYTITIYKSMECLKELETISSIIDFGDCYKSVQQAYNLENRSLIILISDFFDNKKLTETHFYFFDPDTGNTLSIEKACKNQVLTVEKSLTYYPEINIENAKFFENQDINIFNSSDIFYNDLCFYFESPNGKDVPLKERILIFYPNVTLCEDGCKDIGVNLTSMKAICECTLRDLLNEAKDATKLLGLDFSGLVDSLSIDVVKCYKTVFQYKYFIKCYGGFLCLILIVLQTICVIVAYKVSIYDLRKNAFWLVQNYTNILQSQDLVSFPPKKRKRSSTKLDNSDNSEILKSKMSQKSFKSPLINKSQKEILEKLNKTRIHRKRTITIFKERKRNKLTSSMKANTIYPNLEENKDINLKEYLKTSMDDLDYDEALEKENRSFFKMIADRLIIKQVFINLFYNSNWIIPRSIKFIFFIVRIDLYFVVNAVFYNEEYIRYLYYSEEEVTFLSFVPKSLNRIIYTSVVSSVLDFIISLLFPTENKIKKILIRKKNNIKAMKIKIFFSVKNIINNYISFIFLSYALTIVSWYYITCFNNVYPNLKVEWIKSSLFIIIVMQLLSFIECILFSFLRFISLKCKSERLYRISSYFSG